MYIIYSSSLNQYYVGGTQDVNMRLEQHNNGKGNFTSKGIPWLLKYEQVYFSRFKAVNVELKIKKRGAKR
ncbi:MAG: GIY-YIG nuclease family protein [Chitinophagaceae bacterium]|nr:GIY-YIG nuclease family protein [Chitinophagaceae bacterium]